MPTATGKQHAGRGKKPPDYVEADQFELFTPLQAVAADEYRCAVCQQPFSNLRELRAHFYGEHEDSIL